MRNGAVALAVLALAAPMLAACADDDGDGGSTAITEVGTAALADIDPCEVLVEDEVASIIGAAIEAGVPDDPSPEVRACEYEVEGAATQVGVFIDETPTDEVPFRDASFTEACSSSNLDARVGLPSTLVECDYGDGTNAYELYVLVDHGVLEVRFADESADVPRSPNALTADEAVAVSIQAVQRALEPS